MEPISSNLQNQPIKSRSVWDLTSALSTFTCTGAHKALSTMCDCYSVEAHGPDWCGTYFLALVTNFHWSPWVKRNPMKWLALTIEETHMNTYRSFLKRNILNLPVPECLVRNQWFLFEVSESYCLAQILCECLWPSQTLSPQEPGSLCGSNPNCLPNDNRNLMTAMPRVVLSIHGVSLK